MLVAIAHGIVAISVLSAVAAVRIATPGFVTTTIAPVTIVSVTIKDTAIAATIAVPEYMERSQTLAGQSFRPVEIFTTAMVVYFLVLFPATRAVDMLYRRVAHLGRS